MKKILTSGFAIAACFCLCALVALAQRARQAAAQRADPFYVSPLETDVLGQSRWLRGGPAALRVIVSDHRTGKPLRAAVRIALAPAADKKAGQRGAAEVRLYAGRTNDLGTLDARFTAPPSPAGPYDLKVDVDAALGQDHVVQRIQLEQGERILLTTDKPVYQPGQTIHLRALGLDTANRRPLADQPVTFEVEDARGNKVFKARQKLSRFGVGSADFELADEVNMGAFTVRAVLPGGQAEKKVRVERYVLPKFKVLVSTDRTYYLPGETVKGTVQADYFFGKPVAGGRVAITINTLDIGVTKLAELEGKTDAAGAYTFEYALPNAFVGQPFEQGKAVAEFQVRLTDTADHQQIQSKSVPVVKDPVLVAVVPESPQLVPGVPNRVYVACGTPDGEPIQRAEVAVSAAGAPAARVATDELGMAVYEFTPKEGKVSLTVRATAPDGHASTVTRDLETMTGADGVLLRVDRTLGRVGERMSLAAISPARVGTLYIDVIRDRQTILTRAEPLRNGRAGLSIALTPDMVGTLQVHAYRILPNEDIVRDTRTVVVAPADDLTVTVTPDRQEYRPGQEALLRFAVRGRANEPVAAAIGLAIVDESVFALSELQPGLEKVYFMLERELMEPRYEIHGLKPSGLVLRDRAPGIPEPARQRAAAMLLASAPAAREFDYRANTYLARYAEVRDRAVKAMLEARERIQRAAQKYHQDTGDWPAAGNGLQTLVDRRYLNPRDVTDPWGHPYRPELYGQTALSGWFMLTSAGSDGRWGTLDDILGDTPRAEGMARRGGGFGGGIAGGIILARQGRGREMRVLEAAPAAAGPVANHLAPGAPADALKKSAGAGAAIGGGAPEPRVRQYFPETMYWNPALITDDSGRAEVRVPMADSITTWRLSMLASGAQGQMGSATAPLKVFQDFFVDIDLPVSLTQNDRVEIPIAVYNYLPGEQDVTLALETQPWFKLEGEARRTVHMKRNEVRVVHYPLTVTALGQHTLKVVARGSKLSDAIARTVAVTPDGREVRGAINDRLEKDVTKAVTFPADALPGASSLWVKLYPGAFSQVVEGLDGILRMPNGCFEQTSSMTYPNVLVTDYLRSTKRINPEIQMKAEGFINVGYQRLVTFEVPGGGFSWFGEAPAHQVLTAYGLLEFSDMARVHDIDPALIDRTQRWLAGRQKPDGAWPEDGHGIAEGIINRQTGALRAAAYIAWALAESGYKGPELQKAVAYVREHGREATDAYALALTLNLLVATDREGEATANAANALIRLAKQNDKAAWWEGGGQTFTGARDESADLETTGLAAYGLVRWGRNAGFANKVLTYLVQSKDSFGTWRSTQGTVWSLKALLFASAHGVGSGKGTVTVWANGARAAVLRITPEDSDVMRQVDLRGWLKPGRNEVRLGYEGDGSLLYQIASRHYEPWGRPAPTPAGPLSIAVRYDKTTLSENDTAGVMVTVRNHTNRVAEMPLIDLGVPPGFDVVPDELEAAVKAQRISRYTLAQRQIIVYLTKLDPGASLELRYAVKARFPIRARTPLSKAYPYYNPEQAAVSAPQTLVVRR